MMEVTEARIAHTFLDQLDSSQAALPSALVQEALENIRITPVPTTRTEAWKYTRIAKLTKKEYTHQAAKIVAPSPIDATALRIVLVNGFYQPDLSETQLPEGLSITSILNCGETETALLGQHVPLQNELFNAINTAYSQDGICITVAAGTIIPQTIELTHITTGVNTFINQRNLIVVHPSAQVRMVQHFHSEEASDSFTNSITEVFVGKNAQLTIDKVQNESADSNQIAAEYVAQEADSTFTINTLTLNGALVRNNLTIAVNGTNCETNLNGAYILNGKQHVDNHTVVDHKVAHCQSNELYKGVMDEQSTAVFNGKVFVRKDAQKINAFQSNGNVLLSDDATVNSKPELEIYADDVKCSHGSTTGQLDEEAIFYLRARGLSEKSARQLMVSAFVGDVLEKIENEAVLNYAHHVLEQRFGWIA